MAQPSEIKDILLAVKDLIAVTVPFASIWITHQFMSKREDDKYSKDFKQRKIDEFYGPMLSMTIELRGRRKAYEEIMEGVAGSDSKTVEKAELAAAEEARKEQFSEEAEEKMQESDQDLLKAMRELYRDKLWLAESSTVDLFQSFIAIIEISSLKSEEFASWNSLDQYARKNHLFKDLENDLRSHKEKLLKELDLQ